MKKRIRKLPAILVMILLLLAAIPLGVGRTYASLRKEAQNAYYDDQTGLSIPDTVAERAAFTESLITLAEGYEKENQGLTPAIDEARTAAQNCGDGGGEDPENLAALNQRLNQAFGSLLLQLQVLPLGEGDSKTAETLSQQMKDSQSKLDSSSYNTQAEEFNQELGQFPVRFLRDLAFLQPLELFTAS